MTHGRGKKAGRGAGLRGGRGNAGLLKHRAVYQMKYMPDHFGRHGFKRPQKVLTDVSTINVGQLEQTFPGKTTIDLSKEGYQKLLGGGALHTQLTVTVPVATAKAVEKIEAAGGKITTTASSNEAEEPQES